jgi:Nif-specific regulatory protein
VPSITPAALLRLTNYGWPGNVRELENCLESAVVILDGPDLLPEHLPLPERGLPTPAMPVPALKAQTPVAPFQTLEAAERAHILAVLRHVDGNQSHAAKILGIGRNTLARKLRGFGPVD